MDYAFVGVLRAGSGVRLCVRVRGCEGCEVARCGGVR